MRILHACMLAPVVMLGVLSSFGCDGSGSASDLVNGAGPSPVASDPFDSRGAGPRPPSSGIFVNRGDMVQPALIRAQRVGEAFCPGRPPFHAPFNVVMHGDGRPDVFLSGVQMQFVDTAGIRSETMMLSRPELVTRFGSTTFPAFGTRAFPFSFQFGCGSLLPTGTLTVIVLAGDSRGREQRTVAHLPVR
jgi:hypothetical protein